MGTYSPSRPPEPLRAGVTIKTLASDWSMFFAIGIVMAMHDGALPDRTGCGRLAVLSLLCGVTGGLGLRWQPEREELRPLAAAALGFPFGVAVPGIVMPLAPWPPAAPIWWLCGLIFAFGFAWYVTRSD